MKIRVLGAGLAMLGVAASTAGAAQGPPPPPKAVNGATVAVVARGVATPTAFAFAGATTFVAAFGDEEHPAKPVGGVFRLVGGKPVKVPGSPAHAFGLAYASGTLYVSAGNKVLAWSKWDGTRFAKSRVVVSAPKGFSGFNGIAMGRDGKLYAGVSLGQAKNADYSRGTTPYANQVISIDPSSGTIATVATGLRQPWQLLFVPGHAGPLVSDLGQENLGKKRPPDYVVEAKAGANFGFPSCPAKPASCGSYAKPFATFPAHASPMGMGYLSGKLYVALFGGTGKGPEIVRMNASGGAAAPFLTGYAAPVVAVGIHGGRLYTGDLTGSIYSVKV